MSLYPFTEDHEAYREAIRLFVDRELKPYADRWEEERDFPRELFRRVGEAGFFGAKFDPEWGGTGPDYAAEAVWVEELARCGATGVAMDLGAHSQLASLYVDRFGSDDQKRRYLTPAIEGSSLGALAITEPGAGSDVNGVRTRAVPDGDDWVITGSKVFITNGAWADWLVLAARTADDPGHRNITLFVVDAGTPGYEARRMKMVSWHTSHTGEISLDQVRVPDANRLGEVGSGFGAIMENFQWERLIMGLWAVALAELAYEEAVAYGRERVAFGRPVIRFQVWQHRLADLATRIRIGKALCYRALGLHVAQQQGEPVGRDELTRLTSMAKLYTQRLAVDAADECVQIHGGAGALTEYRAQRYWRDARVGPIGGGTEDILRGIIAGTYNLAR